MDKKYRLIYTDDFTSSLKRATDNIRIKSSSFTSSDEFVRQVTKSIKALELFPRIHPIYTTNHFEIRRIALKSYNYTIYYFIDQSNVVILDILHSHQLPPEW